MDNGFELIQPNPRARANLFSKLFFLWIIKICYKGVKKGLGVTDLPKVLHEDSSGNVTNLLESNWNKQIQNNKTPSLLRAITDTFIMKYMFFGALLFVDMMVFKSLQPAVLAYFVALFDGVEYNYKEMYISGGILAILTLCAVMTMHHLEFGEILIGMRVRVSVSSLVYRKLLRLNKNSLGKITAGQLVNLLSNDVSRFDFVVLNLHFFWIGPLQAILITYLGWQQVGISILSGVLLMTLLTIPIQGFLAKYSKKFRIQTAHRTDHRVKLMNEVISGMQVIKMYTWEKPFEKLVDLERKKEVKVLTHSSYLRAIFMSSIVFIERTTLFLTIITFYLLGNAIKAEAVFSLAQYFNILQMIMAIFLPMAVTMSAETLVSISRLQDFLQLPEKNSVEIKHKENSGIDFNHVTASWSTETTIEDFHLNIPKGSLCAIVGSVGAGKSSVLQLVLGELAPISGGLTLGGSLAYSSQDAWLFSSSVRDNILFGLEYNQKKYREVVKVCALPKDFQQLPQGDETLVGERGVALSGGQRARINLARAVYKNADTYLLDDPLSAVDAHVGKQLFEECILKYLGATTRILVTHQLQYLRKADLIVVLDKGRIEASGTFAELIQSHVDFSKLLHEDNEQDVEEQERRRLSVVSKTASTKSHLSEFSEKEEQKYEEEKINKSSSSPFKDYIKASGNWCHVFGLIFLLFLSQAACSGADYWVTLWTQQEAIRQTNPVVIDSNSSFYEQALTSENQVVILLKTNITIFIYSGLILAAIVLTLMRSFAFFKMAMSASKNLHLKMFHCLIEAPMRFFDTNPSGRILNRFSKDMGSIDEVLPRCLLDAIQILLVMFGIIAMVMVSNYYMIVVILIVGVFFLKLRSWYVTLARNIKHLEGITKSPVFSHLNGTLKGITTIRANKAEEILKCQFDHHQDNHTSAWYLTIATRIAFGLWLDILSVTFVTTVIFGFIILTLYDEINGSVVGLAISQSLILTGMLQFGMMQTAEVITQLTSVERIMQYTKLEDENQLFGGESKPEASWPQSGSIQFKNVSLRYSEYESVVLKELKFGIEAGNKIGVVGRTGAGKSSLISALFRLAPLEGSILIDGIDTSSLQLNELRSRIAIIPQEPVLFSSTIRYNLDPFEQFEDSKLWTVIEQVELKDAITSLHMDVEENGGNFSVGQRQLICLARAILKNSKILVLDEATANVDPKTDTFIQKTIRERFRDCTILTIAHRLNTIMDSDKVLVMDAGRALEFDHPYNLLQKEDGVFRKLVDQIGTATAEILENVSRLAFMNK